MPSDREIPTQEELGNLPRWARVAFAARCAARVQPLFLEYWPDAPREHVEASDYAHAVCGCKPRQRERGRSESRRRRRVLRAEPG